LACNYDKVYIKNLNLGLSRVAFKRPFSSLPNT
jgi:hypothetical protein